MEKRRHPLWIGFGLGCTLAAAMVLLGPVEISPTYDLAGGLLLQAAGQEAAHTAGVMTRLSDPFDWETLLALGVPVGAFLGALPERLRRRKRGEKIAKSTAGACVTSFLCGIALLFGAGMAGGGATSHVFSGILQGSVSGFVFVAAMLVTAIPAAAVTRMIRAGRKERGRA